MKASELRIGNFVGLNLKEFDENYFTMVEIAEESSVVTGGLDWHPMRDRQYFDADYLEGIPLTEEWLIRFGFSARLDNLFYVNFFFTLAKSEEGFRLWIVSGTYGRTIHYVHELQNLYFALTGQELTLAPPQR